MPAPARPLKERDLDAGPMQSQRRSHATDAASNDN
jgi:hypothetical protein